MDFKSLLQSMTTLSEAEGTVHKGTYGTSHGKEDVRDQYGHKVGRIDKEAGAKKDAPKKGRGRPKKGADDSGEVKTYDTKTLGSVFGGGQKPKKEVGKVSKKHSLKEYIEEAEQALQEGMTSQAPIQIKPASQTQTQVIQQGNKTLGTVNNPQLAAQIKQSIGKGEMTLNPDEEQQMSEAAEGYDPSMHDEIKNATDDQLYKIAFDLGGDSISARHEFAKLKKAQQELLGGVAQQRSQGIQQRLNQTLKSKYPNIKQGVAEARDGDTNFGHTVTRGSWVVYDGKKVKRFKTHDGAKAYAEKNGGKVASSEYYADKIQGKKDVAEGKDEGKPGKNFAKIAKSAGKEYGSKAAGERVAGAVRNKLKAQGKLEESDKKAKEDYDNDGKIETGKQEHKGAVTNAINKALGKNVKKKVDESISLTESPETLQHIISRFKNEVKRFINGDELDSDLYDALFDYYSDAGEIPYGVAKARTGDPFEWITQRFDQDVHDHVVDENTIRDFTTHGMKEPTSSFTKPGSPMAVPRGTPTKLNRPVQDPTPWGVDPINAATDRAINFISGLGKKENKFEGKDMKDIQLENWEKQLNGLLTEGITVSSSQGQQGAPDSLSITATDSDAQTLMGVLRNAGIGGFGAEAKPEIGYGVASQGEEDFDGTGTEPQPSPDVVGDGDDMMSLLKKMAGLSAGPVGGNQDYEDEEGDEEAQDQTLEPADSGEDDGKEELSGAEGKSDEETTDEGNMFTGNLAKARAAGKSEADLDGDGDMEKVKEDDMEEGNMFTGNLAKARAAGKSEADLDGDGDMEKVKEGEDTCNECGMYESSCECDHEQMNEYANDAGGDAMAETELAKLKALLSMGNDLHKQKSSQAMGNPIRVAEGEMINDWKKLSGIK